MKLKMRTLGVGAVTGLLALGVAGTAQAADPAAPSDTALVAVGSDTTQDVMAGLATAINAAAGSTVLNSYNATGGGTINTRTSAHPNCQTIQRPNGSGAGKSALQSAVGNQTVSTSAWSTTVPMRDGGVACVDVARSSSSGFPGAASGATGAAYRRYELAIDSVSYVATQGGGVAKKVSIFDLKKYYAANGTPGSAACFNKRPLIPQSGSGTRGFWASVMGVTDTLLSDATVGTTGHWGTCVRDTTDGVIGSTALVEEHNGAALGSDGKALAPYSVAQWISQQGNVVTDLRGFATLGSIDWTSTTGASTTNASAPVTLQQTYGTGTRKVYNFVAKDAAVSGNTAGTGIPFNPAVASTFEGSTSAVCSNTAVIQKYGFGTSTTCGAFVDGP